jgi:hypothetical protein
MVINRKNKVLNLRYLVLIRKILKIYKVVIFNYTILINIILIFINTLVSFNYSYTYLSRNSNNRYNSNPLIYFFNKESKLIIRIIIVSLLYLLKSNENKLESSLLNIFIRIYNYF